MAANTRSRSAPSTPSRAKRTSERLSESRSARRMKQRVGQPAPERVALLELVLERVQRHLDRVGRRWPEKQRGVLRSSPRSVPRSCVRPPPRASAPRAPRTRLRARPPARGRRASSPTPRASRSPASRPRASPGGRSRRSTTASAAGRTRPPPPRRRGPGPSRRRARVASGASIATFAAMFAIRAMTRGGRRGDRGVAVPRALRVLRLGAGPRRSRRAARPGRVGPPLLRAPTPRGELAGFFVFTAARRRHRDRPRAAARPHRPGLGARFLEAGLRFGGAERYTLAVAAFNGARSPSTSGRASRHRGYVHRTNGADHDFLPDGRASVSGVSALRSLSSYSSSSVTSTAVRRRARTTTRCVPRSCSSSTSSVWPVRAS